MISWCTQHLESAQMDMLLNIYNVSTQWKWVKAKQNPYTKTQSKQQMRVMWTGKWLMEHKNIIKQAGLEKQVLEIFTHIGSDCKMYRVLKLK